MDNSGEQQDIRYQTLLPYFNWENQLQSCDDLQEFTKLQISQAKDAIGYLRDFLGNDFPKHCLDNNHPIEEYFINKAAWTRGWFIWLTECFRLLRDTKGFQEILLKFKSAGKGDFEEAETLLEYAHKFRNAGFKICYENPVLNNIKKIKKPDLELIYPGIEDKVLVEISRLTPDPQGEKYGNLLPHIIHKGFQYKGYMSFAGQIHRSLSNEHFAELIHLINEAIEYAAIHKTLKEINQPGTLELAIAPYNNEILTQWTAERKYDLNSIRMPTRDPFDRVRSKIKSKADQLSPQHFNLLIIHHEEPLHFFASPQKYMSELEETVYKFADLGAVIISGHEFGPTEKQQQSFGMNYCIRKTERHAWSSNRVIIFNKFNKNSKISLFTLNKIIDAFL